MMSMYKWHQVRVMREKGAGIKEIARGLRISKNKVRRYLRSPNPPTFKRRRHEKRIDAYRDQVREMLRKRYIGTRIYEELKQMEYPGPLAGVHRYIRECKEEEQIKKPSTTRVETPAGSRCSTIGKSGCCRWEGNRSGFICTKWSSATAA